MKNLVFFFALTVGIGVCFADNTNYYNSNGSSAGKSTTNGNSTY